MKKRIIITSMGAVALLLLLSLQSCPGCGCSGYIDGSFRNILLVQNQITRGYVMFEKESTLDISAWTPSDNYVEDDYKQYTNYFLILSNPKFDESGFTIWEDLLWIVEVGGGLGDNKPIESYLDLSGKYYQYTTRATITISDRFLGEINFFSIEKIEKSTGKVYFVYGKKLADELQKLTMKNIDPTKSGSIQANDIIELSYNSNIEGFNGDPEVMKMFITAAKTSKSSRLLTIERESEGDDIVITTYGTYGKEVHVSMGEKEKYSYDWIISKEQLQEEAEAGLIKVEKK